MTCAPTGCASVSSASRCSGGEVVEAVDEHRRAAPGSRAHAQGVERRLRVLLGVEPARRPQQPAVPVVERGDLLAVAAPPALAAGPLAQRGGELPRLDAQLLQLGDEVHERRGEARGRRRGLQRAQVGPRRRGGGEPLALHVADRQAAGARCARRPRRAARRSAGRARRTRRRRPRARAGSGRRRSRSARRAAAPERRRGRRRAPARRGSRRGRRAPWRRSRGR